MIRSLALLLLISSAANADSYPYGFEMIFQFGKMIDSSGDPICLESFLKVITQFETGPQEKADCLSYNGVSCRFSGGLAPNSENATFEGPGGTDFKFSLKGQPFQQYSYDRIVSGTLYDTAARADFNVSAVDGSSSCRLSFQMTISYPDSQPREL